MKIEADIPRGLPPLGTASPTLRHGYLAAMVAVAAAALVRLAIEPWVGTHPIAIIFILPVAWIAYRSGIGAGLFATVLGCAAFASLAAPRFSLAVEHDAERWLLVFLAASGAAVSVAFEMLRRSNRRLSSLSAAYESLAERLAAENRALATAQAVARMGSWEHDIETGKVTWSAQIHKILGTDENAFEPTYAAFMERVHPDDRQMVEATLLQSHRDFRAYELQHRIVAPNGEMRHVLERWQAVAGSPGRPTLVVGTCQDIEERVRAERLLRESEQRYRDLFEASPLPMWAYDAQTLRFVLVNEAAVRQYGYTREEFMGMTAPEIMQATDAGLLHPAAARMVPGRYYKRVSRHRTKDGSLIEVEEATHLATQAGRVMVVSLAFDITQRERERRQRELLDKRLREVGRRLVVLQEEERRAMAADLHDRVGQNLAFLGIQLDRLGNAVKTLPEPAPHLLSEAMTVLTETGGAVRSIMRELRPEGLHDFGLLSAVRILAPVMERRIGVDIRVEGNDMCRLPAATEAAWFRICQEALANVAKHARARNVTIALRERGPRITLCISDDGVGFNQGAGAAAPGWGLLMMRERAQSVGARLRIRTAAGRGTSIVTSVPRASAIEEMPTPR